MDCRCRWHPNTTARFPSPPLPRHWVSAQFKGPGPYVHCVMISVSQQLSSAHTTNTQKITASEHLFFIPRDTHHAWRSQHHHHLTGCGEVGKGPYGFGKIASPTPCVAHFFSVTHCGTWRPRICEKMAHVGYPFTQLFLSDVVPKYHSCHLGSKT